MVTKVLSSFCRQLMENQITVIERGAFDDMKELERLWVPPRLTRNNTFLCLFKTPTSDENPTLQLISIKCVCRLGVMSPTGGTGYKWCIKCEALPCHSIVVRWCWEGTLWVGGIFLLALPDRNALSGIWGLSHTANPGSSGQHQDSSTAC